MATTISGLTAATSANLTDLFETSQDAGGGTFVSRKLSAQQLLSLSGNNQWNFLEITNGMISGGGYVITAPYPSVVKLSVTSAPYAIVMPAANAANPLPEGFFIRFYFNTGAINTVVFFDNTGSLVLSTTQAGDFDLCFTTNSTAAGTPWVVRPYVNTIGPGSKYGNVTLTLNDISDAGTMAAQDASAIAVTGGNIGGNTTIQTSGLISIEDSVNSTLQLDITNLSAGSSAKSQINLGVGSETSGDATVTFFIDGGQLITMGLDNSDLNAFVISNTNALGTGNIFKVDQSGNVTIPGSLDASGSEMSVSWNANSTAQITVYNASNTASAKAQFNAIVQGSSAGDPTITFSINGGNLFTVGLDNSDSDAFVISNTNALGTGNIFRIAQDGTPTFPLQPLGVASGGTGATTALAACTSLGLNGTRTYSGTSDTLVLTDANKLIRTTSASAVTQTIPPNSSVAFPTGAKVYIMQGAAGQVTLTPGAGVTLLNEASAFKLSQYTVIPIIQTDVLDTWVVTGNTVS